MRCSSCSYGMCRAPGTWPIAYSDRSRTSRSGARAAAMAGAVEMRRTRIEERRALRERVAQQRQRPAIRERRAPVIERAHVRVIRRCHRQALRDRLTELVEFSRGGAHDVVVAAFE